MTAFEPAELEALTGQRLGPYNSFNPVSRVQIWQWCSAMGDRNPLYLDEAYQASVGLQQAVAPPAMMQMWTMRDFNMDYAPGSTSAEPYRVFDELSSRGYAENVAVSYDISFHRYLHEGARPHHYTTVVAISPLKTTALGQGYFVTEQVEYLDQHEQCFAEALITYFQYRAAATSASTSTEADTDTDNAAARHFPENTPPDFSPLEFSSLELGQQLPALTIPITHKLVVGGAIASQDFIPVHHNAPAARAAAMPDIFMNILTTCGLCGRYLSDWSGPGARLQKLRLKLLAPNVPGDTMVMQGAVSALGEDKLVDVEFSGANSRGFHVTGSATLSL
ncbi:FAS1-like dehydratase domain-containing protein [Seongchinamella sediminis]|uniref:FAS1-like dehydratase domain-containing protein n=1 Tax=Seongchinamella sediminis TaxID=2283635 RepID=UPI0013C30C1E|nr:MaoC family dehydratase N-terminal domain-containing protein [Seongchinamella sediminis]